MAGKKQKYSCPACNNPDDKDMVKCDGKCNKWHHFKCVGIDQETAETIPKWFCNPCSAILKKQELNGKTDQTTISNSVLNFTQDATSSTIVPGPVTRINKIFSEVTLGNGKQQVVHDENIQPGGGHEARSRSIA